jgi:DNA-binding NarL/FixJ family response regulator
MSQPAPFPTMTAAPALTLVRDPDGGRAPRGAPAVAPLRVLVAHGERLARAGLRALLEASAEDAVEVVAVAAGGAEAVAAARDLRPDVAILDAELGGLDGLEATRRILADAEPGGIGILLLIGPGDDRAVAPALRAGARAILTRDVAPDELLRGLRTVAGGEALLAPSIAQRLIDALLARPEHLDARPGHLDELTDREREVMALVAWGLTNREIAERLVVSPATAKTHVSRAMLKLHAHDRAQLAVLAYQSGLVTAGDPAGRHAAARRIAGQLPPVVAA